MRFRLFEFLVVCKSSEGVGDYRVNATQQSMIILVLVMSLIASGCEPGQLLLSPTATTTPTSTLTPTYTFTPTQTPTQTPTPVPEIILNIVAGSKHTCAILTGGKVMCWGDNTSGQLGNNTGNNSDTPVPVYGLSRGVIALTAGIQSTCALISGGGVKCWGNGQITPVDVSGLASGVTAMAAGYRHTCAVTAGGGVICWGDNDKGQLGDGTTTNRITPVDVSGLSSGVTALAAGIRHTCALLDGGGVKCWGANYDGQLGDGTRTDRVTPVNVSGLSSGVTALAAGGNHTCALLDGGGIKCWGDNWYGQGGDGTIEHHSTPVDVSGLTSGVIALYTGRDHTCALLNGGGVKCWGANYDGQLGDGTTTDRSTPVDVSGLSGGVKTLATGESHTCALFEDRRVMCWGWIGYGQFGGRIIPYRSTPMDVNGLTSGITSLTAGEDHTCAVSTGGVVKCWGDNDRGQLGDGTTTDHSTPVDVSGLTSGVTTLVAGDRYTCALLDGGGVKCWGLDITRLTYYTEPRDVSGLTSGVTALAAAFRHTCALTSAGGVKCWGANYDGELGDGTTTDRITPVDVYGLSRGVIALAAGENHTCALLDGGGVKCWGGNGFGQLGDGTMEQRSTPVDVSGLSSGVTALAAGDRSTCALLDGGGVKCWGANWYGQLGDGTMEQRSTPVDISGLSSGVTALAMGGYGYTCALTSAGGVKCWGWNHFGRLGDGTTTNRSTPVDVYGLNRGVIALTVGSDHICALTTDGGGKCWGWDGYGQLGIGTVVLHLSPVDITYSP